MNDIDVKRITAYNNDCNAYKQKLAQMLAERKILQDNINQQCAQLSQQLGIEVTIDNIDQIYAEKARSIEAMLESGEAILNRIRAAENGETAKTTENTVNMNSGAGSFQQAQPVQQVQPQPGFGGQQPFGGIPTSDFKMPEQFVGMMPNQAVNMNPQPTEQVVRPSNAFTKHSAFNGSFRSIHVAPSNDVDEV